ncbi:MAG: transglutaminase family protein [Candidatus Njordarchaeota archaeon]
MVIGDFVIRTIFSDYYIEIGRIVPITVKVHVDVLNKMRKPISNFSMVILGMREDYHQKIEKIYSEYPIITDRDIYGNVYHKLEMPLIRPKRSIRISIRYKIRTFPIRTVENGSMYEYKKSDIERYLHLQPLQKHTHSKIKEIASKLLGSNNMDTIRKVAMWVYRNIRYEKTYIRYSVTDTLYRRKGSCLSISDLTVALLRSLKIPATVVRGMYMENPHAWVEAYIPRSRGYVPVPIDVLSGFVGAIGSLWFSHYLEKSTRDKEVFLDQKSKVAIKQGIQIVYDGD